MIVVSSVTVTQVFTTVCGSVSAQSCLHHSMVLTWCTLIVVIVLWCQGDSRVIVSRHYQGDRYYDTQGGYYCVG